MSINLTTFLTGNFVWFFLTISCWWSDSFPVKLTAWSSFFYSFWMKQFWFKVNLCFYIMLFYGSSVKMHVLLISVCLPGSSSREQWMKRRWEEIRKSHMPFAESILSWNTCHFFQRNNCLPRILFFAKWTCCELIALLWIRLGHQSLGWWCTIT